MAKKKRKNKQPCIASDPGVIKQPRISNQFVSDDSGQVFWSFTLLEREGPWGFNEICRNELHQLVIDGFKSKEGLNWFELKSKNGCHNVQIYKLIKKAQDRLNEINLEDHEELFSMRFTGKKRLWGIRDGNVFRVLWWDPEHQVCPSTKKHT